MKFLQKLAVVAAMTVLSSGTVLAQQAPTKEPLPDSGTYFIVNVDGEQALQPAMASMGQSVFLQAFNKNGMQKWKITRKIDLTTKKPTNRYTIALAGETSGLNFQPHPSVDACAIISCDTSTFVLDSTDAGLRVKSVTKNGDALYSMASPPSDTETRFGPDDGSEKFRWKFIPAN